MPEEPKPVTSAEIKSIIDRLPANRGKTKALDRQIEFVRTRAAAMWKSLRRIELDGEAEELIK